MGADQPALPSDMSDEEGAMGASHRALSRERAGQPDHDLGEVFNGLRFVATMESVGCPSHTTGRHGRRCLSRRSTGVRPSAAPLWPGTCGRFYDARRPELSAVVLDRWTVRCCA